MSKPRSRRTSPAQLALGLTLARGSSACREGAILAEAAAHLAHLGYEVASVGPARCRLSVEARLRDWTMNLEERDGALVARVYVMRAPADHDARGRVLEAILSINGRSANAHFALDRSSVVVDAALAPRGSIIRADALRTAVCELARTCNDAYPDLLALSTADDHLGSPVVLRVA